MQHAYRRATLLCLAAAALCLNGCTSFSDYVHHEFKVGPEYSPATADVAPQWIDASDIRVRSHAADLSRWWCVFNDPQLNDLVYQAYNQNINLKEYGAGSFKPGIIWRSKRATFSRRRKTSAAAIATSKFRQPRFPSPSPPLPRPSTM